MSRIFSVLSIICMGFFLSCEKDTNPPITPIEDLLADKNWKFEEITFVSSNTLYYYKRGGTNNTWNFSNDAIVFKRDGTGMYTNQNNNLFNINWQFVDAEKTKIRYTIYNYDKGAPKTGVNLVVTWENMQVTSTYIKYAEIYTNSDATSTISSAKRIPL